jgi:hypothetical protein
MNKAGRGGSVSSEGGIRVSADPVLDAPGLMECGDEYVPDPDKWAEDSDGRKTDPSAQSGGQALYDDDDLGSPTTISRR